MPQMQPLSGRLQAVTPTLQYSRSVFSFGHSLASQVGHLGQMHFAWFVSFNGTFDIRFALLIMILRKICEQLRLVLSLRAEGRGFIPGGGNLWLFFVIASEARQSQVV
jgi:hypothetical protein